MRSFTLIGALTAMAACSPEARTPTPDAHAAADVADAKQAVPTPPPFDAKAIEQAKAAFMREHWVKDLTADPGGGGVDWQIGMFTKNPREWGYGETACLMLRDRGLVRAGTSVRIVDLAKLALDPDASFRGASLGQVDCSSGEHLYP